MSKSQVEIVENAARLAADLQAGPVVTKTALLSVVATFMSDPAGDLERLRRILQLLKDGSGGHLKRGAGFGEQVQLVIQEVLRVLDSEEWEADEIRSLFGWTARLLQVRKEAANLVGENLPQDHPKRKDAQQNRQSSRPRDQRSASREENKKSSPPTRPLPAIGGKNLDALEAWKKKLSNPKGEGS